MKLLIVLLMISGFNFTRSHTLSRKARWAGIGLTNGGRINIGVQFILPLTLSLPMVSGKWRRSVSDLPIDWREDEYGEDVWHGEHLKQLDFYFHYLSIVEEQCRVRLICEMSSNPEEFLPLSALILDKIIHENEVQHFRATTRRMREYEEAVIAGEMSNKTCSELYTDCGNDPQELLNMPVLHVWQTVSDYFHIHFHEELDTN